MNLKELFEASGDGAMTYDQLLAACKENGMKLVDLSTGDYVSKKKFEDELASRDTQINTLNNTIGQRDTDLEALKAQLTAAGTDAEKLNQLSADLSSLQGKYDADVKNYQEQLKKQAYEFAVKEFASTKNFTSNAAKRDFMNSMIAKDLQMEGGKILGADDFVLAYSTDNSDAFVPEVEPEVESYSRPLPKFVETTPGADEPSEGFHFNFVGVRAHDDY